MTQGKEKWGKELKDKIHLKKVTPPPSCQPFQCNPLRLIINNSYSMTIEQSVLTHYGLGASLNRNTDPIGSFILELLKEPATTASSNVLSPTLSPQLHNNQARITVVEVKDPRQTKAVTGK
jgi:hypothetical protein